MIFGFTTTGFIGTADVTASGFICLRDLGTSLITSFVTSSGLVPAFSSVRLFSWGGMVSETDLIAILANAAL